MIFLQEKNIIEYINHEMFSSNEYNKFVLASGAWVILGLICGLVLGLRSLYIALVMVMIFLLSICAVLMLKFKTLTITRKLIIQTIVCVSWFLQIVLLETIIFTTEYGWHLSILLLYLPGVLTPIIAGMVTSLIIKKQTIIFKKVRSIQLVIPGILTPLAGWRLGIILRDINDDFTVPIILICFTFVSSVFSVGFLNIQKLYYFKKLVKTGEVKTGDGSMS